MNVNVAGILGYPVKTTLLGYAQIVNPHIGIENGRRKTKPERRNKMDKRQNVFRLAEIFCGPGGLAYGAKQARIETAYATYEVKPVWATDNHMDSCLTYKQNIHAGALGVVVCDDIRNLVIDTIPDFDALAFGFPCNDFSVVGEQQGVNGRYGALYSYGIALLDARSPQWFIAENVSGIQSADDGETFAKIMDEMSKAGRGYRLTAHLYKFEEYGVPQYRHRIVIIGVRKDIEVIFKVPAPAMTTYQMTSAREAIESPPIPRNASNHEFTKQSTRVVERLRHIPLGENVWCDSVPRHLRLNTKKAKLSQIYKRLDPNKPSYTVTGSGGGGTHGYHWRENRALTNRERARLQTFPDTFVFVGHKESVRRQIGMAVPPKASQAIVEAVLKTFAGESYASVPPRLTNSVGGINRVRQELAGVS